ncbi:MAG: family acetyltransferase [Flaviaesturariibacter sp.]|nr:family acetyltransferase [Flaviaesturariibacter sp.]
MQGRNFSPFPVLKTQRLTLRQLSGGDENEILALRSDDEVNRYLGRNPARSIDDARNFIRAINESIEKNESIYWAVTLNGSDTLVGTICLYDFSIDNSKAEIGYELVPGFQGKGFMQEAAIKVIDYGIRGMGLRSIDACTHPGNGRSTRLLEKLGFKKDCSVNDGLVLFRLTREQEE